MQTTPFDAGTHALETLMQRTTVPRDELQRAAVLSAFNALKCLVQGYQEQGVNQA